MNRRGFLGAILAAGMAPAVVKAGILMPVRRIVVPFGGVLAGPDRWCAPQAHPLQVGVDYGSGDETVIMVRQNEIVMEIGRYEGFRFIESPYTFPNRPISAPAFNRKRRYP